ncbi:aldo/keto reductase [Novosphingobium sp. PP1Y]|uniref:aldo/keto reductase n=1 Tax=Novosphingobium sp. PP1Y TaxID=702113 RepID=UPI00020EFB4D|nr:aldo/keto reductase [Novosphingobium sp. PP1Y]CCA90043.1 aldo/keto reductase [Novosphingobium sp. PP1Y]
MEALRLGRSGLKVSQLALGTASFGDTDRAAWNVGADMAWNLVRHAFDRGITLFDTGSTYGGGLAEDRLGQAVERLGHRDEIVLTSKVYFPTGPDANARGLSRKHIVAALDRSRARLRTDYVDVLMLHRWDAHTPIEETLTALDILVRSGRVLYTGASSMSAWRMMKVLGLQRASGMAPFIAMQGLYNLLYREEEREMMPLCREEGIGCMAWSPLARGRLAGAAGDPVRLAQDPLAASRFTPDLDAPVLAALDAASVRTGLPHAQLALGWLAARQAIPVIGAASAEQIDVAIAAVSSRPDAVTCAAMEASYRPHAVSGFDPLDEHAPV